MGNLWLSRIPSCESSFREARKSLNWQPLSGRGRPPHCVYESYLWGRKEEAGHFRWRGGQGMAPRNNNSQAEGELWRSVKFTDKRPPLLEGLLRMTCAVWQNNVCHLDMLFWRPKWAYLEGSSGSLLGPKAKAKTQDGIFHSSSRSGQDSGLIDFSLRVL